MVTPAGAAKLIHAPVAAVIPELETIRTLSGSVYGAVPTAT
jgi:hypothetical protein